MIPRYIRIMDELPLTPTQKVEKHVLRAAGITADTWDREAAGIRLQRQALDERGGKQDEVKSLPGTHYQNKAGNDGSERSSSNAQTASGKAAMLQTLSSEDALGSEVPYSDTTSNTHASNSDLFANPGASNADTYTNFRTSSADAIQPSQSDNFDAAQHSRTDSESPARKTSGPLVGVKVLEFAGLGPAPFCCMLLSDMGADVIRIDKPCTTYSAADVEARGRISICLDLKSPAGKAKALALIQHADILIEGFRPGVMERLGLDPAVALTNNPRLIYGRMTGWGQTGPHAYKPGHDLNYLALTGALHALGSKAKPTVPLNLIADYGGGALYLVMGVLAALHHTRQSGTGQVVDCAMTDGVISMLAMIYGDLADGRWTDTRESNVIDGGAPFYNVYQCSDHKWLALACIEAQFYKTFIEVAGLPQGNFQDQWNRDEWPRMKQQLEEFFMSRPRDEWCDVFAAHDVCLEPVLSLTEAQQHPQNRERGVFITRDGISQPAPTPRLSLTKLQIQANAIWPVNEISSLIGRWGRD
jgi:alpha-methylacyl-CoA racemase